MALNTDDLAFVRIELADPGSSAVQSILIANAVAGTFTISYAGQTTAALAFDAGANEVQNALAALSNVGLGNVTVNNNAPYVVYFAGDLGKVAQPMFTVNTSLLIGAGIQATVSQIAMGGVFAFSDAELDIFDAQTSGVVGLTLMYAFLALCADFSRLSDYVAGQSQEKRSQVYDHTRQQAEFWQTWANSGNQVQITRLVSVPPRIRAVPRVTGVPSTALSIGPYPNWIGRGWRRNGWGGDW